MPESGPPNTCASLWSNEHGVKIKEWEEPIYLSPVAEKYPQISVYFKISPEALFLQGRYHDHHFKHDM